jgi:hypothetical protein
MVVSSGCSRDYAMPSACHSSWMFGKVTIDGRWKVLRVVRNSFAVIPGMNAIAFTREVRALASLEGWAASTTLNTILRGAPKMARTSG